MSERLDGWIVIPNWERWQSRADRHDPWIKNYTDLVHRDEYLELTPTARALLHGIWLLYSLHDGVMRASSVQGALRMRASGQQWKSLVDAGLLVISAAKPPPIRGLDLEKDSITNDLNKGPKPRLPAPAREGAARNGARSEVLERLVRNVGWQYTEASLRAELVEKGADAETVGRLLGLAAELRKAEA